MFLLPHQNVLLLNPEDLLQQLVFQCFFLGLQIYPESFKLLYQHGEVTFQKQ